MMNTFTWKSVLGTIAVGVAIFVLAAQANAWVNKWQAKRAAAAAADAASN